MSLMDDLAKLAEVLAPNFRVSEPDVANHLGALIQYVEHGQPLLEAARAGAQAVADFYHNAIASQAEQDGQPVPRKGAPVQTEAAPHPAAAAAAALAAAGGANPALAQEIAQMAAQMEQMRQLIAQMAATQPTVVTVTPESGQPVAYTTEAAYTTEPAPAPAPEPPTGA